METRIEESRRPGNCTLTLRVDVRECCLRAACVLPACCLRAVCVLPACVCLQIGTTKGTGGDVLILGEAAYCDEGFFSKTNNPSGLTVGAMAPPFIASNQT